MAQARSIPREIVQNTISVNTTQSATEIETLQLVSLHIKRPYGVRMNKLES